MVDGILLDMDTPGGMVAGAFDCADIIARVRDIKPVPGDVRETLQSRMDATRRMFAQKVSAYTGLSVQAVLDTEAAVYSGQEAIDAGLADELVNSTDAITVMRVSAPAGACWR